MTPEEREQVVRERKERGYPLHSPPHFKGVAGYYLITAACYQHQRVFNTPDLLSLLMDCLFERLKQAKLDVFAWVFLPNHYHIVVDTDDISFVGEALRKAHSKSATEANYIQEQKGRKVWYRFSDRWIRNEQHYWATINYIYYNPVKHEYVERMSDWPWSSVHGYWDTFGEARLRKIWMQYPIGDYGKGWDW